MPTYGLFRPGLDTPLQLFGHRRTSVGARATLPLTFILHFFTALLLVLGFVGWTAGCKVQSQNNQAHNGNKNDMILICNSPLGLETVAKLINELNENNITLSDAEAEQLFKRNGCHMADADSFRIIGSPENSKGMIEVQNGKEEGWTPTAMYAKAKKHKESK